MGIVSQIKSRQPKVPASCTSVPTLPPLPARWGAGTAKAVHSLAKELGEHRGSAWKSQSQNSVLWPAAEGRDRAGVSPAELGVHCSSKAAGRNRRWSFMGTEIYRNRVQRGFCQKLQCQWTL